MTPLEQALEHPANDLRGIVLDFYAEAIIVQGRCKAVWRGGDNPNSIKINTHTLHDFKTGETFNVWKFLTQLVGLTERETTAYLLGRAGLGDNAAPHSLKTANRTTAPKQSDADTERIKARCLAAAAELQRTAPTTGSSDYFEHKGITALFDSHRVAPLNLLSGEMVPGLVYSADKYGSFVQVVLRDLEGNVCGYQRLYDSARAKRFVFGTRPKGAFVLLEPIGDPLPKSSDALAARLNAGAELAVVEGFATGASVALARPRTTVFCALSAGNLAPVAASIRQRYGYRRRLGQAQKALELCLWADFDESGTGQQTAHRAALESGCYVRTPKFRRGFGDFNDLAEQRGLETVRRTRKVTPDAELAFAKELGKQKLSPDKHLAPLTLPEPGAALIVRAPQESGKTHRLAELLSGQGLSVLVVTHRESLARNLAARLEFECYTDYPAHLLRDIPRLVVCFDSLQKLALQGQLPGYDLLILDESEQVFEHATGRHIKHKAANFAVFEHYLTTTPRIICADADAGRLTHDTLRRYRPERRLSWHIHEHHVAKGRRLRFTFGRDELLDALEQETRPTWVASDSLRFTRDLSAYLNDPDTLTINSETATTDAAQAYLKDPTRQAPAHRRMIASPSLQTGLSDDSGHWQHVMGDFGGYSSTPQDGVQAVMRARRVTELTVYAARGRGEALSVQEALENAGAADDFEAKGLQRDRYGDQNPNYERLRAEVVSQRSRRQANYKTHFVLGAARLGFEITVDVAGDLTPAQVVARTERRDELKQAGLGRYVADRVSAERIDAATAERYANLYSLSQDKFFALEQQQTRAFYRLPDDVSDDDLAELLRVDDYKNLRRKIERYENFVEPREVAEARARGDLEGGVLRGDAKAHLLRHDYHQQLGKVVGLDADRERHAETWQAETDRLEGELRALRTEANAAQTRRKGQLNHVLRKLETELEAHKLTLTRTTYRATDPAVQTFVRWCCKHYQALKHAGFVTASEANLRAKPLETIGDSLRHCGLKHAHDGKRGAAKAYALVAGSISAMWNYSRHRRENWQSAQQNPNKTLNNGLLCKTSESASGTVLITGSVNRDNLRTTQPEPPPPLDVAVLLTEGRLDAFGPQKVATIRRHLEAGDTPWLNRLASSRDFGRALGAI